MSDGNDDTDKVGYGRPPKAHRFKKGQPSPNPKGRPRKLSETTESMFRRLSKEKILVNVNGKPKKVTAQEAMILSLRNRALKGDLKAQYVFLEYSKAAEAAWRERVERRRMDNIVTQRVIVDVRGNPYPATTDPAPTPPLRRDEEKDDSEPDKS